MQPKFLTKEERAKIAIAKRAQEIKEQKEREEVARRDREALEREAEELTTKERNKYGSGRCRCSLIHSHSRSDKCPDDDRYSSSDRDRDRYSKRERDSRGRPPPPPPPADDPRRDGFQNVPTGPRADRDRTATPVGSNRHTPSSSVPTTPGPSSTGNGSLLDSSQPYAPPMSENDLSAIRSRYLGVDKKKRKIRKMNDRKFVFDWDTQDDTFAEDSPVAVGSNRQGAQIMFGRGHLAGMDDGGGSGVRRGPGGDNLADAMERRQAAKAGFDERHWTEKPLHEMKERDWRIFREDFSISARGMSPLSLSCSDLVSSI